MASVSDTTLAKGLKLIVDAALVLAWAVLALVVLAGLFGLGLYLFGAGQFQDGRFDGGAFGVTVQAVFDGDWRTWVPALLSGAVLCLGVIVICTYLRRIVASLVARDTFTPENAPRLRVIAMAIAVIELARYLIGGAVAAIVALFGQPEGATLSVGLNISLGAWAAVVVLLVLAQVFQEGARLRTEEKFTI
jgi:hypothetical protein